MRGLCHDVADVVRGARTKDAAQALGALLALGAQPVAFGGLLAVADKVDRRVGGHEGGAESESGEESHDWGVPRRSLVAARQNARFFWGGRREQEVRCPASIDWGEGGGGLKARLVDFVSPFWPFKWLCKRGGQQVVRAASLTSHRLDRATAPLAYNGQRQVGS